MNLLSRYRRFWTFGILAVLLLPAFGLVLPDLPAPPGPVDRLPRVFWQYPNERIDPFLNSTFGFRGVVMAVHRMIARSDSKQGFVLLGEAGQLFYTGQQAIEQSLGLVVRIGRPLDELERIARAMSDLQAARGGRFLVAPPPDVATIQAERLPEWLRVQRRRSTLYDLVLMRLSRAGIDVLDLRPILLDAKRSEPVYHPTDTHWNNRGALLAFNATMQAIGRAELALDAAQQLGALTPAFSGDLSRLAGRRPILDDQDYPWLRGDEALARSKPLSIYDSNPRTGLPPYAFATDHDGPSLLIIGDSFTWMLWRGFVAQRFSQFAWIFHEGCRFDWNSIERVRPEILVYAPTERQLVCEGLPRNFPLRPTMHTHP